MSPIDLRRVFDEAPSLSFTMSGPVLIVTGDPKTAKIGKDARMADTMRMFDDAQRKRRSSGATSMSFYTLATLKVRQELMHVLLSSVIAVRQTGLLRPS